MELPKPKKGLLEDYRDNLANDLREIRNVESRDHAQEILAEEKETQRYKMAEASHQTEREDKQSVFIDKNRENEDKKYDTTESFYKIERGRIEEKIKELNNNFYEKLGEPIIFNPSTDQEYQKWLMQENKKNNKGSVRDYVQKTFSGKHYLPDVEYRNYLHENQEKIPESLKDGKKYYFPGSFDLFSFYSIQYNKDQKYFWFKMEGGNPPSLEECSSQESVILF